MNPSIAFIIGPLPFCVPSATESDSLGSPSPYPLALTGLGELCHWIWRVRSWQLEITGLANEFASYDNYIFEFSNHEKTGLTPPTSVVEVIAAFGLNLTHEFTLLDNFGQANEFRLQIRGFDSAFRTSEPSRYHPGFVLELDLLLPGNVPPEELVFRTAAGSIEAGECSVEGSSCGLYTGFPGQITDTWVGQVQITALEQWPFDG